MLQATLSSPGQPDRHCNGLNDVVLQKWQTGRILDFETYIDGRYVNTHGGDGLVIAQRPARPLMRCRAAVRFCIRIWMLSCSRRSARTRCRIGPSWSQQGRHRSAAARSPGQQRTSHLRWRVARRALAGRPADRSTRARSTSPSSIPPITITIARCARSCAGAAVTVPPRTPTQPRNNFL